MSDAWEQRLQQTVQQTWRSTALSLRQGGGLLRALAAEAAPWRTRTKRRGRERVLGIGAPIEIIRDRWGVPHCFAQSADDALFALGYVHAQDRIWQLQWNRLAALGRLAELVGPAGLPADRLTRTLGIAASRRPRGTRRRRRSGTSWRPTSRASTRARLGRRDRSRR